MHSTYELTNESVAEKSREYSLYTWSPQRRINTIPIKKAEGCYYWNYDGKKYFDLCSQLICVNVGHGNKAILEAISSQAEEVAYVKPKFTTNVRGLAAEMIIKKFAPANMGKVLFALGGAEANEYAIRLALKATGRKKIFAQYKSYHGSTYGAAGLTAEIARNNDIIAPGGFIHFWGPCMKDHFDGLFTSAEQADDFYLKSLEEQIRFEGADTVAAVFLEVISGGNGVIVSSQKYVEGVRRICDKYGIFLVIDEVMTGFGRTGRNFAIQHYNVLPDMITFAKGVTSAYLPLGGVIVSRELSSFFDTEGIPIGCTYNSHPMCCAAAVANMSELLNSDLVKRSEDMGELLGRQLDELAAKHFCIKERRGIGLLQAVRMQQKYCRTSYLAWLFRRFAEAGYPTNGNDGIIIFAPPFIVTKEEVRKIISVADDIFTEFETEFPDETGGKSNEQDC